MELTNNLHIESDDSDRIQPLIFKIERGASRTNLSSMTGKRAYQHVELWKRQELVTCITSKRETMKDCSQRLGINYCTAKHIMKVFRRSGSIETDLMKKKKEKHEELRNRVLNDVQFADLAAKEKTKEVSNHCETSQKESNSTHYDENASEVTFHIGFDNENSYQKEADQSQNSGLFFNFDSSKNIQIESSRICMPEMGIENTCLFLGNIIFAKHSVFNN